MRPSTTFGWEVANRAALDDIAERLDNAGVTVTEASSEHAQARQTIGVMLCTDPAGNACELFYGATSHKEAFVSPTSARFSTGDMGLGHAFVIVPDGKAFESSYSMLGFQVSDYITLMPGVIGTFHALQRAASHARVHRGPEPLDAAAPDGRGRLGRLGRSQLRSVYRRCRTDHDVARAPHERPDVLASYWGHARPEPPTVPHP